MHAAYATTYLDNIISHNDAWVVHVQQLTTVLESLRQAELTAHIKKCTVKPREVQYLGYDLEGGQLSRPMTNKKKKKEVRWFLGQTSLTKLLFRVGHMLWTDSG